MADGGQGARQQLFARFDAGVIGLPELDARLRALDRAGDDPAAIARSLEGALEQLGTDRRRRWWAIGGVALAVVAVIGFSLGATDSGGGTTATTGGAAPPATPPVPVQPAQDCPKLDAAIARLEAIDQDSPAVSPSLLSDPAALPDGYSFSDEETIEPGRDPNVAMSVTAGNPAPVETLARSLAGELDVTMRAWRYATAEDAEAAGLEVLGQGVCVYDVERFEVPDRPEILGSVVTGPIPTTAFAAWRLSERRFSVAVVVGSPGDDAATEAARQLAGTIAALELDAARTPPPPG